MNGKLIFLFCFMCVLGLLSAENSPAAIYKYMDKDGLVCFANDLQSIPEQYRSGAKIVSGEAAPESDPVNKNRQIGQPGAANSQEPGQVILKANSSAPPIDSRFAGKSVLLSAIIVVSAVFAFMILGVLETDHQKTITIMRIVILWGVTVYMFYAHSGDMVRVVKSFNRKTEDVEQQSAEKGKKAAKAIIKHSI